MKINLKKMWVVLLIIWCGSFILTYLNMTTVQKIKTQQQEAEAIIMDGRYVKDNLEKFNRVFEKRATLEHAIESVKLGLIGIEDQLKAIALQNGLSKIVFANKGAESGGNRLVVLMTCEGVSEGILKLIETIENAYPFLPITEVSMKKNQEGFGFRFQVMIDYRIKIV